MLPTHDVPCPHCGKTLYWAQSLDDGVNDATPASPTLRHDEHGDFMLCPHCEQRVAMRRVALEAASEVQIDRAATPEQGAG